MLIQIQGTANGWPVLVDFTKEGYQEEPHVQSGST